MALFIFLPLFPEDLLAFYAFKARVFIGKEPAIAKPQHDVTIIKRTICDTVNVLSVYEGKHLEFFYGRPFQVNNHDALPGCTLYHNSAYKDDLWRVEHVVSPAE